MHQLWQACTSCKHSLLSWQYLVRNGLLLGFFHRIGLQSCVTPHVEGCLQARRLISSCVRSISKFDSVYRTQKMNMSASGSNSGSDEKRQRAVPLLKRSMSERVEVSSESVSGEAYLRHSVTDLSMSSLSKEASTRHEKAIQKVCVQESKPVLTMDQISEKMRKLRVWEPLRKRTSMDSRAQEFTLMSYNVLSQRLLEMNSYLYMHCNPEVLEWDYRKQRLIEELKELNCDVLCLQEVQENHYEEFYMPVLQQSGYVSIYKKRTNDKPDGCAIFYKQNAFELEAWLPVEYNKPGVHVLDRDNIGIVALLRPLKVSQSETKLCVATTHLLFNPKRGDVKLAQLQVLFAEMDRLAFRRLSELGVPQYHPIILCGDMNSEPHCDIYKFVSGGALHYDGLPINTMSGQVRGGWSRNYLSPQLLPPYLGITDQCQFAELQGLRMQQYMYYQIQKQQRLCNMSGGIASGSSTTKMRQNSDDVKYSENASDVQKSGTDDPSSSATFSSFSSGFTRHRFNLVSVYNHKLKRTKEPEVTTHHTRASCTVDYIFYSVNYKKSYIHKSELLHELVKENRLSLLETYSLLSNEEVYAVGGLPNFVSSSDHLPLIAKFNIV